MPSVAANGDSNSFASEWIGIDGDGCNRPFNNDLLQIGTETDVASGSPSQPYAWVEYLPFNPTQLPLTDWITISAGDEVQAQMFLGNSSGDPEQNGTYAFFYEAGTVNTDVAYNQFFSSGTVQEIPELGGRLDRGTR